MNINIHKSNKRGQADYGWLKARYSFSFANYYDPSRERFGVLRVLNDDTIDGGGGFDTHPHNNMEIITIPLKGSLEHRDSLGHTSVIREGEVQYMSAGSGVTHSEYNASVKDSLNLLQIWIFPKTKNTSPVYNQINLEGKREQNKIQTIVSPAGGENIIGIGQDAWLSLLSAGEGKEFTYRINKPGNGVFLFIIEGEIKTGNHLASRRDSMEIWGTEVLSFNTPVKSEILIIEVPEN
ncbi:MAG: pirin family protein [Bacteroidales bacterium]|nr:pirin family protein [Bacteroidales bacterium]